MDQHAKPAFSLEDIESGKVPINSAWLREVWGKWPGDEPIEELLAALDDNNKGELRNGEKC